MWHVKLFEWFLLTSSFFSCPGKDADGSSSLEWGHEVHSFLRLKGSAEFHPHLPRMRTCNWWSKQRTDQSRQRWSHFSETEWFSGVEVTTSNFVESTSMFKGRQCQSEAARPFIPVIKEESVEACWHRPPGGKISLVQGGTDLVSNRVVPLT